MPGEPFSATVRFKPAAACYVSERTWSDDQKLTTRGDGSLELEFTATSRPEVISWVLSFGRDAELLTPADLREEFMAVCRDITGVYLP